MQIDTDGRNPSLLQYVVRGIAFLLVLAILFVLLFLRYQGTFTSTVPVTARMADVGDGLLDDADVRYNGFIVGKVKSITLSDEDGPGGLPLKDVEIELTPKQAKGVPENVTARTVPANLFGVNSVELVKPEHPQQDSLHDGVTIPADTSHATIRLQDAQNELHALLAAVPPEDLASVLGTIADALRGGGAVFGNFVGLLDNYFATINRQFPEGAPSGFDNFNRAVRGLSASTPQLLDTLGRSVIPADDRREAARSDRHSVRGAGDSGRDAVALRQER